jgi:hypothetical protein
MSSAYVWNVINSIPHALSWVFFCYSANALHYSFWISPLGSVKSRPDISVGLKGKGPVDLESITLCSLLPIQMVSALH